MSKYTETHLFFILRKVLYQESDLILTLLSDEGGVVSTRARGARASMKRFGGRLSLFRKLKGVIQFDDRFDIAELREVSVEKDYPKIETSFEKITLASYATELLRTLLIEAEGANAPFRLLDDLYSDISRIDDHPVVLELRLDQFILEVLSWWGREPSLSYCHRCQKSFTMMDKLRFLRNGEGLVCSECVRESDAYGVLFPNSHYILRFIAGAVPSDPEVLSDIEALRQVRRVLQASLRQVVTYELKSYKLLQTVFI